MSSSTRKAVALAVRGGVAYVCSYLRAPDSVEALLRAGEWSTVLTGSRTRRVLVV
jgi:hypothetical protein